MFHVKRERAPEPNDGARTAAELLASARRVCVSTGAGMSVASGLSTFRGSDGLWSSFDPAKLATPQAFARDPATVWAWYRERRLRLARTQPNRGHQILAAWERRLESLTVVTQNVDGLHGRAGSSKVIELHGRLDAVRCTGCPFESRTLDDLGPDPHCDACGRRLRPGVVWFGEMLPAGAWEAAVAAVGACDLLILIGTSGAVQPAASLAEFAVRRGASVVEINPNASELSHLATVAVRADCVAALEAIASRLA